MNGDQFQRHIDEASERVFDKGIDNASQADLMLFGFGYLATIIQARRNPASKGTNKKLLAVSGALGAALAWIAETLGPIFLG